MLVMRIFLNVIVIESNRMMRTVFLFFEKKITSFIEIRTKLHFRLKSPCTKHINVWKSWLKLYNFTHKIQYIPTAKSKSMPDRHYAYFVLWRHDDATVLINHGMVKNSKFVLWCHHDVTVLVNHGMVKNSKTWIPWERKLSYEIKKS